MVISEAASGARGWEAVCLVGKAVGVVLTDSVDMLEDEGRMGGGLREATKLKHEGGLREA